MNQHNINPDLIVMTDECGDSLWETVLSQADNKHDANEPNNALPVPTTETTKNHQ